MRRRVYEAETRPVLAHYPQEIIVEIDGVRGPAVVLQDLLEVLAPLQDEHFGNALDEGAGSRW
jgi:hypothetical protein